MGDLWGVGEAQEMVDAQLGSAAYPLEGKPYSMKRRERSEGTWDFVKFLGILKSIWPFDLLDMRLTNT